MTKILKLNPSNVIDEKNTYKDVLAIINNSKDYNSVISIVDEFIEESRDKVERIAILISICNILPKTNKYYLKYERYINAIYEMEKFNIEAYKKYCCDEETLKILQEGFYFIIEDYNDNPIAMSYLANRFIIDIFEKYKINLEQELHKKFKKYEDLEKYGINKYLINLISKYDSNLSSYIICHINTLDNLKINLLTIKNNWNNYREEIPKYPKLKLLPKNHD